MSVPRAQQPPLRNTRARSTRRWIHDAPQDAQEELPFGDHDLLGSQLPRRLQEPWSCPEVREQEYYDPAVQLEPPPVLATELYGRIYLEFTFRWCQE